MLEELLVRVWVTTCGVDQFEVPHIVFFKRITFCVMLQDELFTLFRSVFESLACEHPLLELFLVFLD